MICDERFTSDSRKGVTMSQMLKRLLLVGLLCCLLTGCLAEHRREVREKATDLQTRVAVLQQRVDAQDQRIAKLENEVAEIYKRR